MQYSNILAVLELELEFELQEFGVILQRKFIRECAYIAFNLKEP